MTQINNLQNAPFDKALPSAQKAVPSSVDTHSASEKSVVKEIAAEPASFVDLSADAKKLRARLENERATIEMLQALLNELKGHNNELSSSAQSQPQPLLTRDPFEAVPTDPSLLSGSSFDGLSTLKEAAQNGFQGHDFEKMIEQHRIAHAGGVGGTEGKVGEQETFVEQFLFRVAFKAFDLELTGQTEELQKLKEAVSNGTLLIEDPSDVKGLDVSYEYTATQSAAGTSSRWNLRQDASGSTKTALENNLADVIGRGAHGAFYVNWQGDEKSS